MSVRVALYHGDSRADNIAQTLALIADQVDLAGRKCVLIKPNLVSTRRQLAATHGEALRPVLDFVRARYSGRVVIAEGPALVPAGEGFENFGYSLLARQYQADLLDLNTDQTLKVQVYDRNLKPLVLRLARTVVESDYRISVCPPKTHDLVIVTLTLKNIIMGSLVNPLASTFLTTRPHLVSKIGRKYSFQRLLALLRFSKSSDKIKMHQGIPVINLNLALLAPWVRPHLAVVDGFQAMEGDGPVTGEAIDWQIALAATDALAVDHLTAQLMGFNPADIGYLSYSRHLGLGEGDLSCLEIVGNISPDRVRRAFRPHSTFQQQLAWRFPGAEAYLHHPKLEV
jgi:uncharacterized protein (DUF362 family)